MVKSPIWLLVLRGIQFVLALIILALAGTIIPYAYQDSLGFAIAVVSTGLTYDWIPTSVY
jgi:hypothetical protein